MTHLQYTKLWWYLADTVSEKTTILQDFFMCACTSWLNCDIKRLCLNRIIPLEMPAFSAFKMILLLSYVLKRKKQNKQKANKQMKTITKQTNNISLCIESFAFYWFGLSLIYSKWSSNCPYFARAGHIWKKKTSIHNEKYLTLFCQSRSHMWINSGILNWEVWCRAA